LPYVFAPLCFYNRRKRQLCALTFASFDSDDSRWRVWRRSSPEGMSPRQQTSANEDTVKVKIKVDTQLFFGARAASEELACGVWLLIWIIVACLVSPARCLVHAVRRRRGQGRVGGSVIRAEALPH
jgi:hypothetical protein